jgi:hypothetical protein
VWEPSVLSASRRGRERRRVAALSRAGARDAYQLIDIAAVGCHDHRLIDAERSPGPSRRGLPFGVSSTRRWHP